MVKIVKNNCIILGLSEENMNRLKNDEPIGFNLKDLGLEDRKIFIFYGKDNQTMYQMFKDQIDPLKTIIIDHNAKNN